MTADYKCASVGCYSYRSPEKNQQLQRLQTTVNQFLPAVFAGSSFQTPLLKVDGIIGKGTTTSTLIVLDYLAEIDKGVIGSSAASLAGQINTPEQLTIAAQVVLDILMLALKQPPPIIASHIAQAAPLPAPTPSPSAAQIATTTANKPMSTSDPRAEVRLSHVMQNRPALKASLIDRVPPWATYAGGAALAIGALVAVIGISKKRRTISPPTAGYNQHWYT